MSQVKNSDVVFGIKNGPFVAPEYKISTFGVCCTHIDFILPPNCQNSRRNHPLKISSLSYSGERGRDLRA